MTSIIMICLALAFSMTGAQGLQEEQPLQDLAGYKLSALKLTNTSPLDSEFLRGHVFSINNGDPYDTRPIKEGLDKIVRLYGDLGYLDFAYNPHLDINQGEKTVSCSFEFFPGTRYSINEIHVLGVESSEFENEIKSVLNIQENRFFSPVFFNMDLKRLRGFLEAKNLALKDYEFKRSSDQPGTVDISIWVQLEK